MKSQMHATGYGQPLQRPASNYTAVTASSARRRPAAPAPCLTSPSPLLLLSLRIGVELRYNGCWG